MRPPIAKPEHCEDCLGALDIGGHARCDVCEGRVLCLRCAADHFCTPQCPGRGCLPGLCVRVVRDGRASEHYGVAPPG